MLFLKKLVCVILKNKKQLLKSTRLYSIDRVTGAKGYNLAAVMLLGKDDAIADVVPAYVTEISAGSFLFGRRPAEEP